MREIYALELARNAILENASVGEGKSTVVAGRTHRKPCGLLAEFLLRKTSSLAQKHRERGGKTKGVFMGTKNKVSSAAQRKVCNFCAHCYMEDEVRGKSNVCALTDERFSSADSLKKTCPNFKGGN